MANVTYDWSPLVNSINGIAQQWQQKKQYESLLGALMPQQQQASAPSPMTPAQMVDNQMPGGPQAQGAAPMPAIAPSPSMFSRLFGQSPQMGGTPGIAPIPQGTSVPTGTPGGFNMDMLRKLPPQLGMPLLMQMVQKQFEPDPGQVVHEGDTLLSRTGKVLYQSAPAAKYGEKGFGINPDTGKPDTYTVDEKTATPKWLGIAPPPEIDFVNGQAVDKRTGQALAQPPVPKQAEPYRQLSQQELSDKTTLAGAEAKARQDATFGITTDASGNALGTLGKSTIDPTMPGYNSAIVGKTGLTQAAIDQKALSYGTGGTIPPQGRTGMSGLQNSAISNRMAEMFPGGNLAVNKTQLKSFSQSLNQQQKYLDTTQRALNTANDTLDSLQIYMQKNGVNPSQFPDYNTFSNWMKSKGIDPGTAGGYSAQLATLRAEYSNVLAKGGVRSVETDREAAKLIPDGLSPKDLAKVAAQVKIDGENAVRDAEQQVAKITGQLNGAISGGQTDSSAMGTAPSGGHIPFANAGGALPSGVTEEDITHTLKLHPEITRSQLLQKLGGQ